MEVVWERVHAPGEGGMAPLSSVAGTWNVKVKAGGAGRAVLGWSSNSVL